MSDKQDNSSGKPRDPDPDFSGPVEKRGCTDILILILFIAYWVGMFIIAGYAVEYGDPRLLLYPKDSFNNTCGLDNTSRFKGGRDLTDFKYLYWPDISNLETQVCVKDCPTKSSTLGGFCDSTSQLYCKNVEDLDLQPVSYTDTGSCCPYQADDYFYRCVPLNQTLEFASDMFDSISENLDAGDAATGIISDIAKVYHWIILCSALAVVLGFFWLIIIRLIGGGIIYVTAFLVVGALAGLTIQVWRYANDSEDDNNSSDTPDYDTISNSTKAARIIAFVLCAITVIFALMIIFLRKRINIAIEICKEAGRVMASMPSLILSPILPFLAYLALSIYWIWIMLYIATAEKTSTTSTEIPTEWQDIRYLAIYHTIGFIWSMNTITAVSQCAVAGGVATYYFSRNQDYPSFPVFRALFRTLFYHLGSMAFGALILTIVQVIRIIIAYLQAQAKAQEEAGTGFPNIAKYLLSCLQCCCFCIENIIKYINKNAYIQIAIRGHNFCSASMDAFELMWRNALQLSIINFVGDYLIFLGKITIAALCGLISVGIFRNIDVDLSCWIVPVMIIVVLAYGIASFFLAVYEMTIDTLVICFCEDRELNARSGQYFMSEELRNAIGQATPDKEMEARGDTA